MIPDTITTEESSDITIMCYVTGNPIPDLITWSESQGSLPDTRSVVSEGNLTILNVTTDDNGSYVCTATNVIGSSSSSVQLQVYTAVKFITRPPPSLLAYIGQTLNLSCSTSSGGHSTISWMFNRSYSLPQGASIDAFNNLIVLSTDLSHGGIFTCSAMNSLRSMHANVTVYLKYPETCSRVKANISDISGDYVIDPDGVRGEASLTVFCNMTDKGGVGVTFVSHDSENRTYVMGFEDPGSYSRDIQYIGASLSQIRRLIDVSTTCRQFIKYECNHSFFTKNGRRYAWWVSYDGAKMTYWGETTQDCECGMTNSCANPSFPCNCDKNDFTWREDSGFLTNKSHLPVIQLRFGDTGHFGEKAYHTLGKLECYGMN